MTLLKQYFINMFSRAHQSNKETAHITDMLSIQFASFVKLSAELNTLHIIFNDVTTNNNLQQQSKVINSIVNNAYYKVNIDDKQFVVSGKFLRRFLAGLSLANSEYNKINQELLRKVEQKIKNARENLFLYLFVSKAVQSKATATETYNTIAQELDLSLAELAKSLDPFIAKLKSVLAIPAEGLYNALKKVLPDAYARFFTAVGLVLPYALFLKIVYNFIVYMFKTYNGIVPFLPVPLLIVGVAIYFIANYELIYGFISSEAHKVDIKVALIFACFYIGISVLSGWLMRKTTDLSTTAGNLAMRLER